MMDANEIAVRVAKATLLIDSLSKYLPAADKEREEDIKNLALVIVESGKNFYVAQNSMYIPAMEEAGLEYSQVTMGSLTAAFALGHKIGMQAGLNMAGFTSPAWEQEEQTPRPDPLQPGGNQSQDPEPEPPA